MIKRDEKHNTITFENDNEFIDWAVVQSLTHQRSDGGTLYLDFEFTPDYYKALDAGTRLYISDDSSQILKHQCVTYHTISRPVDVYHVRMKPDKKA